MEDLLKQIINNTEPKKSFSIVVSDNKTRFKTWFKPPIQLDKKKDYEIALETYYSEMFLKNNYEVDFGKDNSINNLLGFHSKLYISGFHESENMVNILTKQHISQY